MSLPLVAAGPIQTANHFQDKPGTAPVSATARLSSDVGGGAPEVSLSSGATPLALVFKTAVDGMHEALGGQTSTLVISQDSSPTVTSARIVAMSIAFYQAFRQKHLGEAEDVVLQEFLKAIHKGIDSGFDEARGILSHLHALDGATSAEIDSTYQMVQQGLHDFAARQASPQELAA